LNTKKKNAFVELLRFLFCVLIFLHHSDPLLDEGQASLFPNGAIAVEFFFILSGYLAAVHLSKREDSIVNKMCYSMKYSLDKVVKLFPYAAFGIICTYGYYLCVGNSDAPWYTKLPALKNLPGEITFMTMAGVIPLNLVDCKSSQLWFVSALMIALPIVMFVSLRFKDVFKGWMVWFLPPILYGYMGSKFGTIFAWGSFNGVIYGGIIRAIADMTLGFAAFYTVEWLNSKKIENVALKILATIYIPVALALTVKFSLKENGLYDQILITYIIFFVVIAAFSNLSYTSVFDDMKISKVFGFLGKLAMPIYCIQWAVLVCTMKYTSNMEYLPSLLLDFGICILLSLILMFFVNFFHGKNAQKK